MINKVLVINGQKVDLPDNAAFNLVWQCANPGELKIYGSGSSTIKLPFTPVNDRLFERARFVNVKTDIPYAVMDAQYYEDGILMIRDGRAYLLAVSDTYEVSLSWGNTDLIAQLKDRSVSQMGGPMFKWDRTMQYPFAETSSHRVYTAFYSSGSQLMFRHALSRPVIRYVQMINLVGLGSISIYVASMLPNYFFQLNAAKASGITTEAVRPQLFSGLSPNVYSIHEGMYSASAFDLDNSAQKFDYKNEYKAIMIASVSLSSAGMYEIVLDDIIKGIQQRNDVGWGADDGLCFFLSTEEYNEDTDNDGHVNTYGVESIPGKILWTEEPVTDLFRSGNQANAPVYEATSIPHEITSGDDEYTVYSRNYTDVRVPVVAIAWMEGGAFPENLRMTSPYNLDREQVTLDAGTYYLYVTRKNTPPADSRGRYYQAERVVEFKTNQQGFMSFIDPGTNNGAEIDSPDSPALQARDYTCLELSGYQNAYEIIEDFIKLFPLFVRRDAGKIRLFTLADVFDNRIYAYDWSSRFIELSKTEFGNKNLGSVNWCRYAEYDGYKGLRGDASFTANSATGEEGDYSVLDNLGTFDTLKDFPMPDGSIQKIPQYKLANVETEEDSQGGIAYVQDGLNDMPAIFFSPAGTRQATEDGVTYSILGVNTSDTDYRTLMNTPAWYYFLKVVRNQQTVTIKACLKAIDVADFNFEKPVYFSQIAKYVFVQKITYKGQAESTIVGVILNN